ncbi:MAG: hypothetical protein JST92_17695, partial [Deltaproteobacteria bacterium]|nr:hypothetical protein [Deltaproteobacteria bacterium]
VAVLGGVDAEALAAKVAKAQGLVIQSSQSVRATVEDAFVAMVHHDERAAQVAA